ncbi:MAG TPA: hypothetical protein VD965_04035 [Burkholderiales bacterium]|nr:hypothetical protein [Burkholderiales bacterium]
MRYKAVAAALLVVGGCATGSGGGDNPMTFFITSVGTGRGGDLGGLEGADRHCQQLAAKAGAGNRTWRAYLSTQGKQLNDPNVVHARDRIGTGPWHNAKGVRIARDVADLHSASNNINKDTGLDETGKPVNDRTMKPNKHDILTGSRPDGTAFAPLSDMTCSNWTNSGKEATAMVGHHDKAGPIDHPWAVSWNSSHASRGGCGLEALRSTGGDGLFYCFAASK